MIRNTGFKLNQCKSMHFHSRILMLFSHESYQPFIGYYNNTRIHTHERTTPRKNNGHKRTVVASNTTWILNGMDVITAGIRPCFPCAAVTMPNRFSERKAPATGHVPIVYMRKCAFDCQTAKHELRPSVYVDSVRFYICIFRSRFRNFWSEAMWMMRVILVCVSVCVGNLLRNLLWRICCEWLDK